MNPECPTAMMIFIPSSFNLLASWLIDSISSRNLILPDFELSGNESMGFETLNGQNPFTAVCDWEFTRKHYLAVVFIFVKIQKLLIYVLKDQKICHKFHH